MVDSAAASLRVVFPPEGVVVELRCLGRCMALYSDLPVLFSGNVVTCVLCGPVILESACESYPITLYLKEICPRGNNKVIIYFLIS